LAQTAAGHAAEAHGPMHQFEIKRLLPLEVLGLDASFTNASLFMLIALVSISAFLILSMQRRSLVPTRLQSVAELAYEYIANMVRGSAGEEGMRYFPWIFTIFVFILTLNMLGMIPGSFTVAGAVAVLTGVEHPWLGLAFGVASGLAAGAIQGTLIVTLGVRAVGLTLGGFLTLIGITYILTGGSTIAYPNHAVSSWLYQPTFFGLVSNRGLVVLAIFLATAAIMFFTRLGRDIIATGSNRNGAPVAGVPVELMAQPGPRLDNGRSVPG